METSATSSEKFLSIEEICERLDYKKQTVYNKIHRKEFIAGKHYYKPNRKKLLFNWVEIKKWVCNEQYNDLESDKRVGCKNNNDQKNLKTQPRLRKESNQGWINI